MQRKFNLPDLFLAVSLSAIAIEAALGSLALIKDLFGNGGRR